MTPDQVLTIADKAAQQASAPGGVIWILIVIIICLFIALIFFVKWMFNQATGFTEYLKTSNKELGQIVTHNTTALATVAAEIKESREHREDTERLLVRLEQELRRTDRRT